MTKLVKDSDRIMHELSIAAALLEQVLAHAPPRVRVRALRVRAGPMRCIEPQALEIAWELASQSTPAAGARLDLDSLPWRLRCPDCGQEYEAQELSAPCVCGGAAASPVGGDELMLISIEVDDPADPAKSAGAEK